MYKRLYLKKIRMTIYPRIYLKQNKSSERKDD